MKIFIKLLFLLTLLSGCKGDTGAKSEPGLSLPGGDHIEVRLWVLTGNDCGLKLYFAPDEDSEFSEANTMAKAVKADDDLQELVFHLPQGMLTPQLRVDIKGTPEIALHRAVFVYGKRYIDVSGKEVFRYFRPDVTKCTVERQKGIVKLIDGSTVLSLYPQEAFMEHKMKALTQ